MFMTMMMTIIIIIIIIIIANIKLRTILTTLTGHAVAQLVEALRYKPRKIAVSIPAGVIGIFH